MFARLQYGHEHEPADALDVDGAWPAHRTPLGCVAVSIRRSAPQNKRIYPGQVGEHCHSIGRRG